MTNALSKHLTQVRRIHTDPFGVACLDAHAWVEDKAGNVVFDPEFQDLYGSIKFLNGCALNAPMCREAVPTWEDDLKEMNGAIADYAIAQSRRDGKDWTENDVLTQLYQYPQAGNCFANAKAYNHFHPETVVRIGKAGWRKSRFYGDTEGPIHWEYG
jgi:hypothetical protein